MRHAILYSILMFSVINRASADFEVSLQNEAQDLEVINYLADEIKKQESKIQVILKSMAKNQAIQDNALEESENEDPLQVKLITKVSPSN